MDYVFKESIASLHAAYFAQGPYMSWKNKSAVKVLDKQLNRWADHRLSHVRGSDHQLSPVIRTFVGSC